MRSGKTVKAIRRSLLGWYQKEKRDLPWRKTRNPYFIWVSEIMLQQTQVKTVIPYYKKWIAAFPTVKKLAESPENRVLKIWEGLGYYSRARNIHKAAKVVTREYGGKIPDNPEDILKLPGIGRYTSGAILSIAFEKTIPVVDGNVIRVLSRLFTLPENGAARESENKLYKIAENLLPRKDPGDFNQAMMELGATVCLPKKPSCPLCPVKSICQSRQLGLQESYPPPKLRAGTKKIEVSAAVILRNGKTYIQQRPLNGLMGGLWEFPGGKREKNESMENCLLREIREELGVDVVIREKLMTIKHSYTQFRVTLHVYFCKLPKGRIKASSCEDWKWALPEELSNFPFPAANAKIVDYLINNGNIY